MGLEKSIQFIRKLKGKNKPLSKEQAAGIAYERGKRVNPKEWFGSKRKYFACGDSPEQNMVRLKNLCKTFYIFIESKSWITRSSRVMTDGG
jgi:hypothetical protein